MRLAVTAHLLSNSTSPSTFDTAIDRLHMIRPDALLVLGPTASTPEGYREALDRLVQIGCPVGIVAGPEDLFTGPDEDSYQRFSETLPALCAEFGVTWLEHTNMEINNIGIAGTMAWYDYSSRDAELGYAPEQYAELKGLVMAGARHLHWSWSDRELSSHLLAEFAPRLESLNTRRDIETVVVVSHFAPFAVAPESARDDLQARFRQAYEANLSLGRILAPRGKVRYAVSAGPRSAADTPVRFGSNEIRVRVLGPQPQGPALEILDL